MRDRRIILAAIAVLLIGGVAFFVRKRTAQKQAGAAREQQAAAGRAVPVVSGVVQRRDVPIYLEGLGSVTAFKTVTVRSQVDGRLEQVLFREGQLVKSGEMLARIDPRPFANQLHQAEGALARDKAQLVNAELNVKRYTELREKKMVAQQQVDDAVALVGQLDRKSVV